MNKPVPSYRIVIEFNATRPIGKDSIVTLLRRVEHAVMASPLEEPKLHTLRTVQKPKLTRTT